jgi:hypothetical protein
MSLILLLFALSSAIHARLTELHRPMWSYSSEGNHRRDLFQNLNGGPLPSMCWTIDVTVSQTQVSRVNFHGLSSTLIVPVQCLDRLRLHKSFNSWAKSEYLFWCIL